MRAPAILDFWTLPAAAFERVTFCPRFARGSSFVGNYAVVGISLPRHDPTFVDLPLQENLEAAKVSARCGLLIIDLSSGDVVQWLRMEEPIRELYDGLVLPGVLRPRLVGLKDLWRELICSLPFFFFGLLILGLSVVAGTLVTRGARLFYVHESKRVCCSVVARSLGAVVFCWVPIVLRVSGLTQLALTVVGGTGLIGLAVGIAFRDIAENFLASIFLSMQQPFETGDLVEVTGVTGYVQQLNVRTTILMTFDGNLVQIPNASVYKANLFNFTTNANRRSDIVVGIGYDDSINEAQEIARKVLEDHPAVLNHPEPSVLAESMGTATINLRVYFWLNGHEYSWMKVRSSLIRLIKIAYQKHGISMPDEAREVVFPQAVPS